MKIISIVGARPQFIKLVSLSREIRKSCQEIIIHTGQHFDNNMSKVFFDELNIPIPDINLGISGGDHGRQTGEMIIGLEKEIKRINPTHIIIYGDTNSTLAGSIVGSKLKIPIIHIEAGLRSYNRAMPEEINRIIADHASDYLFAPTGNALNNLYEEGLEKKSYLTGDLMVDTLLNNIRKAKKSDIINRLKLDEGQYYLLTLHRPYNVDDPSKLNLLLNKLIELDAPIIFPAHPRTHRVIKDNNINTNNNVKLIKPVGYFDFLRLEEGSRKILTDSGGIQKEAYILKKPCITIRTETEWVETIEDGWNILASPNDENFSEKIISFHPQNKQRDVFGKNVAKRMLEIINSINK